jgi:hypothetical protein
VAGEPPCGKECPVREHIRKLIELAARSADPRGVAIDGHGDAAFRLAAETIRLARLAASTHMVLRVRAPAREPAQEERTPA